MSSFSNYLRSFPSDLFSGSLFATPFEPGITALFNLPDCQNHAPQLCWVSDDILACVWMAGSQEGTASMSIVLSFLSVGSSCWSHPQVVSQDSSRSEQNPLLFVANDELLLVHTAQQTRSQNIPFRDTASSFSMQWTARLRIQRLPLLGLDVSLPDTWGLSAWSRPSDLLDQPAFCRNPPHLRADGCWLLPIYRSLEEGGAFGFDHSQVLVLSSAGFKLSAITSPADVPQSTGRVHGSIVFSENNQYLLQFFRSRLADRIYCSRSDLDGHDWSIPEPTNLPNNNSSIQARRLLSGRLAMIYNRFSIESNPSNCQSWGEAKWPRTRWPLSIALSEDDGVTWPWIRDIDTGFGFCGTGNWTLNGQLAYPSLLEGQPGELHIAYSWGGRTAIRYVCLQEHNIIGFNPDY